MRYNLSCFTLQTLAFRFSVFNYSLLLLILISLLMAGCDNGDQDSYTPRFSENPPRVVVEYILGVHPLHNPKRLHEIFGPITDYLTEQIPGAVFQIEASRNYAAFDEKLYSGHFHFALPNPYQTVNSLKHGYTVFGKMADDE
ncbi:MAG: PhnD/SsuA/transferrin family substrate-binding protein, partial [Desulfocapsa sp.]|nr:PhnD/SsuA/transferrin family substrate-binding protein [Desulfocapsa sp.]